MPLQILESTSYSLPCNAYIFTVNEKINEEKPHFRELPRLAFRDRHSAEPLIEGLVYVHQVTNKPRVIEEVQRAVIITLSPSECVSLSVTSHLL